MKSIVMWSAVWVSVFLVIAVFIGAQCDNAAGRDRPWNMVVTYDRNAHSAVNNRLPVHITLRCAIGDPEGQFIITPTPTPLPTQPCSSMWWSRVIVGEDSDDDEPDTTTGDADNEDNDDVDENDDDDDDGDDDGDDDLRKKESSSKQFDVIVERSSAYRIHTDLRTATSELLILRPNPQRKVDNYSCSAICGTQLYRVVCLEIDILPNNKTGTCPKTMAQISATRKIQEVNFGAAASTESTRHSSHHEHISQSTLSPTQEEQLIHNFRQLKKLSTVVVLDRPLPDTGLVCVVLTAIVISVGSVVLIRCVLKVRQSRAAARSHLPHRDMVSVPGGLQPTTPAHPATHPMHVNVYQFSRCCLLHGERCSASPVNAERSCADSDRPQHTTRSSTAGSPLGRCSSRAGGGERGGRGATHGGEGDPTWQDDEDCVHRCNRHSNAMPSSSACRLPSYEEAFGERELWGQACGAGHSAQRAEEQSIPLLAIGGHGSCPPYLSPPPSYDDIRCDVQRMMPPDALSDFRDLDAAGFNRMDRPPSYRSLNDNLSNIQS